MTTGIICSGYGGQGVLTTGILIASMGHKSGHKVTWYPSYGTEMRGGTANCNVKLSDVEIGSPYCKNPDILLTMNEPAIDKFESSLKSGGYLFVNASLTPPDRRYREDIHVVLVDVEALAKSVGNPKGGNIAMLGVLTFITGLFDREAACSAITNYFESKGKGKFNALNVAAFEAGYNAVSDGAFCSVKKPVGE